MYGGDEPRMLLYHHRDWEDLLQWIDKRPAPIREIKIPIPEDITTMLLRAARRMK